MTYILQCCAIFLLVAACVLLFFNVREENWLMSFVDFLLIWANLYLFRVQGEIRGRQQS